MIEHACLAVRVARGCNSTLGANLPSCVRQNDADADRYQGGNKWISSGPSPRARLTTARSGSAAARRRRSPRHTARRCTSSTRRPCARGRAPTGKRWPRHYPGTAQAAYASKAYLCTAIAQLFAEEGLDLDVVSGGELHVALQAGFPRRAHPLPRQQQVAGGADPGARSRHRPHRRGQLPRAWSCWRS